MIWASAIIAIALIAWKALDNQERQAARTHERSLADAYASARADYARVEDVVVSTTEAIRKHGERIQRVEEWQAIKQREGFGRSRS